MCSAAEMAANDPHTNEYFKRAWLEKSARNWSGALASTLPRHNLLYPPVPRVAVSHAWPWARNGARCNKNSREQLNVGFHSSPTTEEQKKKKEIVIITGGSHKDLCHCGIIRTSKSIFTQFHKLGLCGIQRLFNMSSSSSSSQTLILILVVVVILFLWNCQLSICGAIVNIVP